MRTAIVTGGIALALTLHSPAAAQMVEAGVIVRSGPVVGHVVVADPAPVYHERRVVVVERYTPRIVVVERARWHRGRGWWRQHGYRAIVVYYDARRDRFYDRWHGPRRGIREVVVYERRGRYYADDDWRADWRQDWRDDRRDDRRHDRDEDWRER